MPCLKNTDSILMLVLSNSIMLNQFVKSLRFFKSKQIKISGTSEPKTIDKWALTLKHVDCILDLVYLGKKSQVAVNYVGLKVGVVDVFGLILQLHYRCCYKL